MPPRASLWLLRKPAAAAAKARRGPAAVEGVVDDDDEDGDAADETMPAVATPAARARWPAQLIFAFVAKARSSAERCAEAARVEERMTKGEKEPRGLISPATKIVDRKKKCSFFSTLSLLLLLRLLSFFQLPVFLSSPRQLNTSKVNRENNIFFQFQSYVTSFIFWYSFFLFRPLHRPCRRRPGGGGGAQPTQRRNHSLLLLPPPRASGRGSA